MNVQQKWERVWTIHTSSLVLYREILANINEIHWKKIIMPSICHSHAFDYLIKWLILIFINTHSKYLLYSKAKLTKARTEQKQLHIDILTWCGSIVCCIVHCAAITLVSAWSQIKQIKKKNFIFKSIHSVYDLFCSCKQWNKTPKNSNLARKIPFFLKIYYTLKERHLRKLFSIQMYFFWRWSNK